ncbi:MAG: ArsR family transcriptional regulator [Pedobacter sp.]|nr:MAG: ArsR family transcriptional regulator [Pedobacter sp.]
MAAAARRDVFQAIADPVRREILGLIAFQPMNLNTIADQFSISRPAISNHIKILEECGMVVINQKGRERYCEAKLDTLGEVNDWIERQDNEGGRTKLFAYPAQSNMNGRRLPLGRGPTRRPGAGRVAHPS